MKKLGLIFLTCILICFLFLMLYSLKQETLVPEVVTNVNDKKRVAININEVFKCTPRISKVNEENNITENTVSNNTVNKNTTNKNIVTKNTINENTINENTVNKNTTNKNTTNKNITNKKQETEDTQKINNKFYTFTYGKSEMGKNLTCYSISPKNYTKTILMVFAIHGYEDAYAKDGKVLVNTAEYLINKYKTSDIKNTRILIVKCANPDGLYDGNTNNGFGRCNSNGIDLNRNFDIVHKVFKNNRNKTLEPFSETESRALRDLVLKYSPDIVLDFHGWLNYTIGDKQIADVFSSQMGLKHKTEFNSNCNGYFSYWAHSKGAKSLLVEFKNTNISKTNLVNAINKLIKI